MDLGTIGDLVGGLAIVAFILVFVGFFVAILYFQIKVIRRMFSRELKSGEVFVSHRLGSTRIETLRDKPGRYWFFPSTQIRWEFVRLDEAVIITSEPTEIEARDGISVILTVSLTMDIINPTRYVTVMIGKQLEGWRKQTLPALVAQAASGYSVTQILNDRAKVASTIAHSIGRWLADDQVTDLGLELRGAGIIGANRPPMPGDASPSSRGS